MGCDVHLHIEVKIKGRWECYNTPNVHRNYNLFAKMAGVRNRGNVTPISEPRGLPEDLSEVVKISESYWGPDAHSHSWLDSAEISELEDWYEREFEGRRPPHCFASSDFGYFFGNSYGGFAKYPEDRPSGIEDLRFVFWFDN